MSIAKTPSPPYYAVIFTSIRTPEDDEGYGKMAHKMVELAAQQEGYLGHESAREKVGITVSYWASEDAIRKWKAHAEHQFAQKTGKTDWYQNYCVRVAKVERAYDFSKV